VEQARRIKERIRAELELTASVGIAEVKFAAKIASDLRKPDGLVVVPEGGVREFLAPLPVSRLWGVGPKTEQVLLARGLKRIGDVATSDRAQLERELGSLGPWLHDLANGIDDRDVEPDREAKSIGAEETFEQDLEGEDLLPFIHEQALRVASRLRRGGMRARSVHLKVKFTDFRIATRQETLPSGTEIYAAARRLLAKVDPRPVRLTGVHAGDLGGAAQLGLFEAKGPANRRALLNASLDRIADRFGADAVVPADLLARKK
jgi:DNA polymerase IV